jgi:hypothetical protein
MRRFSTLFEKVENEAGGAEGTTNKGRPTRDLKGSAKWCLRIQPRQSHALAFRGLYDIGLRAGCASSPNGCAVSVAKLVPPEGKRGRCTIDTALLTRCLFTSAMLAVSGVLIPVPSAAREHHLNTIAVGQVDY